MPDNPFDTPDAPDMGEISGQQQQISNEALAQGRFAQAYGQNLDKSRMGLVMPAIQNQQYLTDQFQSNGQQQQAVYDSTYRPLENLQVLDAIGGAFLSPEQRARILKGIGGQQRTSLRDSYLDERRTLDAQRAEAGRVAQNASAAARNNTATRDAAAREAGQPAGFTQPAPGGIAPAVQPRFSQPPQASNPGVAPTGGGRLVGPVPGQPSGGLPAPAAPATAARTPATVAPGTVYANRAADARNDFLDERGQIDRNTQAGILMSNARDAAMAAAEGRARGDVLQAEGRNLQGIGMTAGRMGVDPSRALAVQGAMAPDLAATAVNAGNLARFGERDRQTAALAGAVGTGRQINATAAGDFGAAMSGNNAVANNYNNTINQSIQAQNAGLPWYNAAAGALQQQANTMNQQYQNELASFNSNPLWDIAGTAAGAWAGSGFPMPSSPDLKMDSQRMDRPDVLEAVKGMDTDSWEYKPETGLPPGRHIGPYADQMQAIGMSDGKTVDVADTAGLALASVKQLAKDLDEIKELMKRGSAGLRRAA